MNDVSPEMIKKAEADAKRHQHEQFAKAQTERNARVANLIMFISKLGFGCNTDEYLSAMTVVVGNTIGAAVADELAIGQISQAFSNNAGQQAKQVFIQNKKQSTEKTGAIQLNGGAAPSSEEQTAESRPKYIPSGL
jgi:hypothetical protein